MYKFVKIKDTRTNLEYPWILECTDVKTLMEHSDKCMGHTIREGVQDWFDKQKQSQMINNGTYKYTPHYTTRWAGISQAFAEMNGTHFIKESTILENKVHQGKVKQLLNGRTLYLREIGSYMIDCDTFVITDELIHDTLVYPDYTEEDIKITKWEGGSHYYAKIGKMDVIDEHGNQKWNTHERAMEMSLVELNNLQ